MNAGKRFHDTRLNPEVTYGYHALAIDEKRRDFAPCLWDESNVAAGQTIEQVWFAGVHADVGGWYDERGLSNIALRWMLGKAAACGSTGRSSQNMCRTRMARSMSHSRVSGDSGARKPARFLCMRAFMKACMSARAGRKTNTTPGICRPGTWR